jgi:tryptophan synthase alpha chain
MAAPDLSVALAAARQEGRKILVPYLMAGVDDEWLDVLDAVIAAGADAVEVGLPFSDPIIDGPVIQEAGSRSLERGTTAVSVLAELSRRDFAVPLVVMTYFNLIAHLGLERFAGLAASSGISGAIVPDLSLEELDDWERVAESSGIAPVLLVAPSTPPARAAAIAKRSRGFVYAVARMGVTGVRSELGPGIAEVVEKIRATPSAPILVGIGVSTPEQAKEVASVADGVIVGSALVRRLLDGAGPQGAGDFVGSLRAALDEEAVPAS